MIRRRLFTIVSAASLLLCVATCALWVRSYRLSDTAGWYHTKWSGWTYHVRVWVVCSDSGGLLFSVLRRDLPLAPDHPHAGDRSWRPVTNRPRHLAERAYGYPYMRMYPGWGRFGFGYFAGDRHPSMKSNDLMVYDDRIGKKRGQKPLTGLPLGGRLRRWPGSLATRPAGSRTT